MAVNGTPSPFVTLVSSDGFEFHVRRSAACVSATIRRMLDMQNNFSEAQTGICHLENISGIVLEKVVEYFYYNEKHRNSEGVPDMDFPSELCLELLMAADYLIT
ncbi:transcription elongation factor B, polypeptide 1 [Capronia coronata CBS 617.96]|uniref:E3 ubiquitin ligase complex SCF subunit sconC n=1 Tax=Capronia coronata CBS 617.96 TaxID=1182541 RepID=W9ZI90_9EURO|nr:transcription elongation factor B, polypeptide 1 [Capronia coronata CBS 617.96]EXJ94229.1 transcription elongation factor B, polypeptide 1 [Capronia coronata CBS 617.96]